MTKQAIVGVPRVPDGMIERTPLVARIGLSPLTVIRAPGGSGKTVLMAQWAEADPRRGAWITVEPDAGDRSGFWSAVAEAIDLPLPDTDRGSLVHAFRTIGEPTVLVVDDAHELRDPAALDDLLAVLHSSRNLSAIVGTRTRTELEAPAQALTLDITVIDPDQLLLSSDDVGRLIGADGSRFGSVDQLLDASDGNPLLLRAILAGSSGVSPDAVVRDHLRVLFGQHGDGFAAFASATAVPDEVDLAAAQHLSGVDPDRIGRYLIQLEGDGMVMRRAGPDGPRFRYHPLIREVLRERFRQNHPDEYRHASLLASADAEARKQYVPALRHAVDAEDYARASDIVLHGGFTLIRAEGAAAVLQNVPLRSIARMPFLAVVLGLAANARGERLKALELLTLALAASRAGRGRQRVAERVGLALIETVVLRITGRAADSVTAARRMLTLLDEAALPDLDEIADQLGSYRLQAAISLFRAGRATEARTAAERVGISAASLAAGGPEPLGAASLVAVVEAARGEATAAATLDRIDDAGFPPDLLNAYAGALAHLARGILALEQNDPAAAAAHAAFARDRGNLEHGMLFTTLQSMIALWRAEPEIGLEVLDNRERSDRSRARLSAEDHRLVAATRVLLHAALGQTGPAHSSLRSLDRTDPLATVLHATLLLQEEDPARVIERLSTSVEGAGPRILAATELLAACASVLRDDTALAEAALRRFLAIHDVHHVSTPVLLIPADHRDRLWQFAEAAGVDPAVIAALSAIPAPLRVTGGRVALTPREAEVLRRLRDTSSLTEIAATLSVSANTVKSQVRTLYRKLEVANRDEALRAAQLQGLLRD
jgi:LuxR family maltose regulon positive regulatory protein